MLLFGKQEQINISSPLEKFKAAIQIEFLYMANY